jgi:DNA-binding SARP family transcriptional activator/TolB-like protein/Flp pilus assembly protein TadD
MPLRPVLRLNLLGRLSISVTGEPCRPIQLPTRKSGALLAYLAMNRDCTASREELAALLWGGCTDQQARQSLRQALALLRKNLEPFDGLHADVNIVRLDPESCAVDAREFDALSRSQNADDLARAARLFVGDFLSGLNIDEETFDDWVRGQRSRLQLAASHLCETFVKRPDLVTAAGDALSAVDQLVALDPLREDWHRLAITLYGRYRGKHEALARAGYFAELLQRELAVAPEPETRALIEELRGAPTAVMAVALPDAGEPAGMAPVVHIPQAAPETAADVAAAAPAARPPTPWWVQGMVAVAAPLAIALLVGITWDFALLRRSDEAKANLAASATLLPRPDPWRSPIDDKAQPLRNGLVPLIVLPFTAVGGTDDATQLAADMLTDDLTNTLSRVPSFRIISRQTARSYQGQAIDVARLGAELQVRYVLEGNVRLNEGAMRVNVELINPATRLSVWSGHVERGGADHQGVRDEIVGQLARELQFEVQPIESARLSEDSDANALAYRGWAALSQIRIEGYQKAKTLFDQALERDPQNLSALTGLGAYHARMGVQVFDTDPMGHRSEAEKILRGVLVRDPNSSRAHFYLALALNKLPTLPEAMQHFERAIRIDPSDASAHAQIGNALIRTGHPAEGLEHVRYAMRLSPRDPIMPVWLEFAGNAELELKNYPEAIALFQRSIALNAGYPRSWAGLVAGYALADENDAARQNIGKLRTFAPELSDEALVKHFGRHDGSKLREGLAQAFTQAASAQPR